MAILIDYLQKAENFLRKKQIPKPRLETQILFSHILNLSRVELYTNERMPLNDDEISDLREVLVEKASGKPTAYILGKKEFYSSEFIVSDAALIPRPETEEFIEWIIKTCDIKLSKVLDLGTGTGCIGITLQKELRPEKIILSDISKESLALARQNAEKLGNTTEIRFIESDLLTNIQDNDISLIVSNPPYITLSEYQNLEMTVRDFEPKVALLVDHYEGFFTELCRQSYEKLVEGGLLYLEVNPVYIDKNQEILQTIGFKDIHIKCDLSEKSRFLKGQK